jgi:hypothetical protein
MTFAPLFTLSSTCFSNFTRARECTLPRSRIYATHEVYARLCLAFGRKEGRTADIPAIYRQHSSSHEHAHTPACSHRRRVHAATRAVPSCRAADPAARARPCSRPRGASMHKRRELFDDATHSTDPKAITPTSAIRPSRAISCAGAQSTTIFRVLRCSPPVTLPASSAVRSCVATISLTLLVFPSRARDQALCSLSTLKGRRCVSPHPSQLAHNSDERTPRSGTLTVLICIRRCANRCCKPRGPGAAAASAPSSSIEAGAVAPSAARNRCQPCSRVLVSC